MQVPAFSQMLWPTIVALKELGGSAANDELLPKVAEVMQLTPDVQNVPHTDGRQSKVSYNLHWSKTYLKKAGYVDNSARGVWTLTEAGEGCTPEDVARVPALVRKMAADARKNAPAEAEEGGAAPAEALEANWKDRLLDCLRSIQPDAFERLSQRLLREAGFIKVEVTGRSGDGGIDGIGVLRLNLLSFQVLFQCKRYSGSVGPGTIRDFRGAMVGRSDKGLLITTATFTAEAKREATRDGAPPIELIDGEQLCDLLKQLKLGVSTELVEKVVVDPSWFSKI